MDNRPFISYEMGDRSFVAFAKREISEAAANASFRLSRAGIIDIVVSELTSNIMKHATGGELLCRFSKENGSGVFEIVCMDGGPGIKDISHSMTDGVSTAKTLGHGLGALRRLSDSFQVYSIVKWGTVCYAKVYADLPAANTNPPTIRFSALNVSKPGQMVSGDGFEVVCGPNHTKAIMCDGLGHGKEAYDALQLALANFKICPENDPARILEFIHTETKNTRGLVATAVTADHRAKKWRMCGIGNIATRLYEGVDTKNYVSYNGIIGLTMPATLKNHETDLSRNQCLIMSSDGIGSRWTLSQFPSILRYDPLILATAIYKECARKNDDMSILIAKT